MTEILDYTCPACDFERGEPGKPVQRGSQIECLACGSSWKEYGNTAAPIQGRTTRAEPLFNRRRKKTAEIEEVPSFEPVDRVYYPDVNTEYSTEVRRFSAGLPAVFATALILILGVAGTLYWLDLEHDKAAAKGLHVENIRFEEIVRPGGQKIVRVQGMLENDGYQAEPVKRIAIVLRKANGDELLRWYHSSRTPFLKPGRKTGFVTAMAVTAPAIASVDALIE